MRVTHNMLTETMLRNLNTNVEKLDKLQNELTTGKRISSPSDDPIGAAASLQFKTTLGEIDQFIKNVDAGNSWLGASDSALSSIVDLLHRAHELAVQGANDTLNGDDRQAMAKEVEQLLETGIQFGNASYAGQFLFSGFQTNTEPFSGMGNPPAFIVYKGDSKQIMRQIDTGSSIAVNLSGDGAIRQALTTLIGLRDALTNGDGAAVSAKVGTLDSALNAVISEQAEVGARMNRLNTQKDALESFKVNVSDLLSKTEDTDMTEAISDFALQQNVYKAALGAGSKAITPSLMDYLVG